MGRKTRWCRGAAVTSLKPKPWKLLLWTAVAGLIFGLIGAGEYFEDAFRVARNSFHEHDASGQVVIIKIDDQSLREYRQLALAAAHAGRAGGPALARRRPSAFSTTSISRSRRTPADDRAFADAIQRSGRVTLLTALEDRPIRRDQGRRSSRCRSSRRMPNSGIASVEYNWQNAVWRLPYGAVSRRRDSPVLRCGARQRRGQARHAVPGRLFGQSAEHSRLFGGRRAERHGSAPSSSPERTC